MVAAEYYWYTCIYIKDRPRLNQNVDIKFSAHDAFQDNRHQVHSNFTWYDDLCT
jgi:hypothetical protein